MLAYIPYMDPMGYGAHGILKKSMAMTAMTIEKKEKTVRVAAGFLQSFTELQVSAVFWWRPWATDVTMNSAQRGQVTEGPKCLFEGHDGQATWIRISMCKSKETNRIKQHQKWNMCVYSILNINIYKYYYTLYVSSHQKTKFEYSNTTVLRFWIFRHFSIPPEKNCSAPLKSTWLSSAQ